MSLTSDSPTLYKTSGLMRTARKRAGLSQVEVAQHLGVSQGALSKLENGILVPNAPQWFQFCDLTSISPDSLASGYLETLRPISDEIHELEQGYRLEKRYLQHRSSKVRTLLPWINYLKHHLGETKVEALCDRLKIDNDIFLDYDFQVSLELLLDLLVEASTLGLLTKDQLFELRRVLILPRNHGSISEVYQASSHPAERLERLIENSSLYERNFHYSLESVAGKNPRQTLMIKPALTLAEIPYRRKELGDFLCQYKRLYFSNVPVWGSKYRTDLIEKECLFHGSNRCIYEIRYQPFTRNLKAIA